MTGTRRIELALRGGTVAGALVAAAALLWPASVPVVEIAPAGLDAAPVPTAASEPTSGDGPSLARAIVAGNVFSASRAAPRTRYRASGAGGGDAGSSDAAASAEAAAVPRLYGIVPARDGAAALLRLDPAVEGAQLYRVGDRGGRYRVESIEERSVVLTGPGGRRVLTLAETSR